MRLRARALALAAAAALLLASAGCGYGRIYTRIVIPLDTDFQETPVMSRRASDDVRGLQYYGRLDWGTAGIGEIAKQHGLAKIHYADVERLELLGIFSRTWVHVYGEKELEEAQGSSPTESR